MMLFRQAVNSPPSKVPYALFRIYMTSSQIAGNWYAIGEVELRPSVGGPDLTTPSSACSASSTYSSNSASKIVDNAGSSGTSTWQSNGSGDQWVTISPNGNIVSVVELAIWPVTGYLNDAPKDFLFQGSNDSGATWNTIKSITGVTGWATNTAKTFVLF